MTISWSKNDIAALVFDLTHNDDMNEKNIILCMGIKVSA